MTISLRLNELDGKLIKAYAEYKNISTSELLRLAVFEIIEEAYQQDIESHKVVIEGIK